MMQPPSQVQPPRSPSHEQHKDNAQTGNRDYPAGIRGQHVGRCCAVDANGGPDGEDPLEVAVGASIEVALLPPPPPVFVPLPMPEPPIMPPMPEPPPMPVGMADPDPDPDPVPVAMPVLVFGALVLVSPDEVSCRRALGVSLQVFFRFCHPRQPREHSGIPLTWAATTAARVARKIETNFIFGLVDVD